MSLSRSSCAGLAALIAAAALSARAVIVHPASGKQVAFRIICCSQIENATPDWVRAAGAKGIWFKYLGPDSDSLERWEPTYDDPVFLEKLARFLTAFAGRYDGHPAVAFVDVGSFGLYGEGHTGRTSRLSRAETERMAKIHMELYRKLLPKSCINSLWFLQGRSSWFVSSLTFTHKTIYNVSMKTTLDIPDSVYREFKARTAANGEKMRSAVLAFIATYNAGEWRPPQRERRRSNAKEAPLPDWAGMAEPFITRFPEDPLDAEKMRDEIVAFRRADVLVSSIG